jgi:hypothetical protein
MTVAVVHMKTSLPFRILSRLGRLFNRVEAADRAFNRAVFDVGAPLAGGSFAVDPQNSAGVVAADAPVAHICRARPATEICETVIVSHAIRVVDLPRLLAGLNFPSYAVGKVEFVHGAVPSRGGQGRALLTQRFRPVFCGRFWFCSQSSEAKNRYAEKLALAMS